MTYSPSWKLAWPGNSSDWTTWSLNLSGMTCQSETEVSIIVTISQPIRGEYYLISISRSRVKSQWFSFSTCTTPHGYCRARTFLLPT